MSRTKMTDDEVRTFIRDALRNNPRARHTAVLREFRSNGKSCEQRRFANLFKKMRESSDAY